MILFSKLKSNDQNTPNRKKHLFVIILKEENTLFTYNIHQFQFQREFVSTVHSKLSPKSIAIPIINCPLTEKADFSLFTKGFKLWASLMAFR